MKIRKHTASRFAKLLHRPASAKRLARNLQGPNYFSRTQPSTWSTVLEQIVYVQVARFEEIVHASIARLSRRHRDRVPTTLAHFRRFYRNSESQLVN
jgi:hypothetical protein